MHKYKIKTHSFYFLSKLNGSLNGKYWLKIRYLIHLNMKKIKEMAKILSTKIVHKVFKYTPANQKL